MKKLILVLIIALTGITGNAQNAQVNASGNYVAIAKTASKEPAKNTGKTFTDAKGTVYPVMESAKGKLFYVRTSKTGNEYRVYLKL